MVTTTEIIRLYEGDIMEVHNVRGMGKQPKAKWTASVMIYRGPAYAKAHKPPKPAKRTAKR